MNFMEAVEQMKQGKKVRRAIWKPEGYITIVANKFNTMNGNTKELGFSDCMATDWEVVEDDSEWNLLNEFCTDGSYDIEDIQKCRDLIIKDFLILPVGSYLKAKIIVNQRFGDLK